MTVKNLIWKFDDEEKSWIIPDLATKNMLIENKFICFGIKVLQTRGTKKAALQDLKIWILSKTMFPTIRSFGGHKPNKADRQKLRALS